MILAREALALLQEGNHRFVSDIGNREAITSRARRLELAATQEPFAAILGCSDSRVPVEIVFDQGLGDLFVIRVAGNIVAPSQIGSVEFAAEQFGTRLVVVLGHTQCGAVAAALTTWSSGKYPPGHLASIVRAIEPAVETAGASSADAVMRAHVIESISRIYESSEVIAARVRAGKLALVAAEYQLATQLVDVLGVVDAATVG